jgi:hypothetical protein
MCTISCHTTEGGIIQITIEHRFATLNASSFALEQLSIDKVSVLEVKTKKPFMHRIQTNPCYEIFPA